MSTYFGFYDNERLVGFYCINGDGYLLQFYLCPENQNQASELFVSLFTKNNPSIEKINCAFVSCSF
jgi:hypothetical protein